MQPGLFECKHAEFIELIEGDQPLPTTLSMDATSFFLDNKTKPQAWMLYHRVACLTEGSGIQTGYFLRDFAHELGDELTSEIRLQVHCDRLIGTARCANLHSSHAMALTVAEQFMEVRDALFAAVNNNPALVAYAHYAYGRATLQANLPEIAHLSFRQANETWPRDLAAHPADIRVGRNLVYLLWMAKSFGIPREIDTISQQLQQTAPDAWLKYGLTLVNPGGLSWFERLDIRW